jgi:hypothetical protein
VVEVEEEVRQQAARQLVVVGMVVEMEVLETQEQQTLVEVEEEEEMLRMAVLEGLVLSSSHGSLQTSLP